MKLATFEHAGRVKAGIISGGRVTAFDAIASFAPRSLEELLHAGEPAMAALRRAAPSEGALPLDAVRLLAPIRSPRKFLAIGLNYRSHVEEARDRGLPIGDLTNQIWFNKQTSCITGPFDPIHRPSVSEQLDYEVELGVVIGRRCRHVAAANARRVIAGYLIVNDVSVRDWQKRSPTAMLGKSFDTHGPIGPWLTTADDVPDPEALSLRTLVDGVVMQAGNTSELINGIGAMIEYLTTVMTLEPGDILATGTPAGMAVGRTPPPWLRAGQVVRAEIEGLGHLENPVIEEPLAETTRC